MIRTLRINPAAENAIARAYAWYEGQRNGLGDELLTVLDDCFRSVLRNPEAFPILHRSARRALVRRFPYCVYFVMNEAEIVVLAVLHGRRNPQAWRQRI
jgi:plasmid stabilization system protein ParE